ncbi:MAG: heavy-metal-associated domain-containing protein [Armatimonadota bacterium]
MVFAIAMIALLVGVALAAAPKPAAKAPQLTPVTVSVDGFHCQACPDELQKNLAKLPGVSAVNATLKPAQVTAKLDEKVITASQFVAAVAKHPRAMDHSKTYGAKLVVYVDAAMCAKEAKMCAGCFKEIPRALQSVKGLGTVSLDNTGKVASITFAKDAKVNTAGIAKALKSSSYKFTVSFTAPAGSKAAQATGAGSASHEGCKDHADADKGSCSMKEHAEAASDGCCGK